MICVDLLEVITGLFVEVNKAWWSLQSPKRELAHVPLSSAAPTGVALAPTSQGAIPSKRGAFLSFTQQSDRERGRSDCSAACTQQGALKLSSGASGAPPALHPCRHGPHKRVSLSVFPLSSWGPDLRAQLTEQMKILDCQVEVKQQQLSDLSDFLRRRGDIEAEYARALDKLTERFTHKTKK